MIALFFVLAGGLAAAGIAFVVWPLVRGAPSERVDRRSSILDAHRARLLEIEGGEAPDAADEPASGREERDDVARALLRDIAPEVTPEPGRTDVTGRRPRRATAVVLGAAFPVLAAALYLSLGEPGSLRESADQPEVVTAAELVVEVRKLLDEAETLARANGNRLEGEPARLIERALAIYPDHRKALWFAAIAALHEHRAADARERLERLRGLGPLDETETRMYEQLMNEATARLPEP